MVRHVLMASTPFISAWEFDSFRSEADGERFHDELRGLVALRLDEWRDSPLR
jgi:hypothetical protein